ncbi:MAG: patatin-like phospholipase family protein [Woeseiaceae bacterium]
MANSVCQRKGVTLLLALMVLLVQGCASVPARTPMTEEAYPDSRVLGMTGLRFWGDEILPIAKDLPDELSIEELRELFPGLVGREMNLLAISGGGANGAFAAGLLNAWTDSGTRPEFNIVTGISTGALIAPFAFLGPDYDDSLEKFYTQYSTKDLVTERGWLRTFMGGEAGYNTDLLREELSRYIDEDLMLAIAAEHKRGRMLFVGTTNLDAARAVNWDIGAIASSGKAGALNLIRNVILASASIPIAFPPVMIDVEANGQTYDEMHTDGGVSRQSFMFYMSAEEDAFEGLNIVGQPRAYIIRNSKLETSWQTVDRRVYEIAGRSASSMVHTQGIGDLYREFLGASKFGVDFNLAYIPQDFDVESEELFDKDYMKALYRLGYELAIDGYTWKKLPPGLGPR